jgi:hypothetical protein
MAAKTGRFRKERGFKLIAAFYSSALSQETLACGFFGLS